MDLDAAWQLVSEFDAPAAAIIKHTNPCGCAEQDTLAESLSQGVRMRSGLGLRRRDRHSIARWTKRPRARSPRRSSRPSPRPDYSPEALAILTAKKNLRLMRVAPGADPLVVKSISGGYLAQTADYAQAGSRRRPS